MSVILSSVLARIELEEAMRPYKPKTPAQMRLKTDPAHVMMRQAYKRRTGADKKKEALRDKAYIRRNKAQIMQRRKRSAQLHGK